MNSSIFIDSTQSLGATLAAIDAAAKRGERRLNVVVTVLVDLAKDFRIQSYGGYRADGKYQPFDDALHGRLNDELRRVFVRLRHHNMEVFILPHIDAGGDVRTWRNWVDFDPLVEYGGHSYEQLVINTIADALAETLGPKTNIELALSGEMGTSLFRYPASYRTIIERLRARADLPQLKVGISLNHGGISGQNNPSGVEDIVLNDEQRATLQRLINECDFVGMSFYRPVSVRPTPADFVRGIEHFMGEFAEHGLSVPTATPMHFSEVGIGGGHDNDEKAADPARAVQTPWSGTGDPRRNPWREAKMRRLRLVYHRALVEFLTEQPAAWRVSAAFFWSTGSWDPLGVRDPAFADPEIVRLIEAHNRSVLPP